MITLPQLKALAKQNKIHYGNKNKDELVKLLIDNNIITASDAINSKITVNTVPKITVNTVKRNYDHLKGIRTNPKTVDVFDKETGKITIFPSKYKTGRTLGINSGLIEDGVTLKNCYVITVK